MGWKERVSKLETRMDRVVNRLDDVDSRHEPDGWSSIRLGPSVADRLSALEAKVGEGKCFPKSVTLCPCIKCCTIEDTTPTPQPGDRVKLRDVPVGRWVRFDKSRDDIDIGVPLEMKAERKDETIAECISGSGLDAWRRCAYLDTLVTLLPEDYEPEGNGILKVQNEIRVQQMSDDSIRVIYPDGTQVNSEVNTTVVIQPSAWEKYQ